MRYAWVLAGGGLAATLAAAAAIAASGHFRVVNDNDRYAIDKISIAYASFDEGWTPVTMKAGTRSGFAVSGIDDCEFNVRVRRSDGSEQEFQDVNLCKDDTVTVR